MGYVVGSVAPVSGARPARAKVAFRLRETRGPSSPVVTPLRECTLARGDRRYSLEADGPAEAGATRQRPHRVRRRGDAGLLLADPRTGEAPAGGRGRNVRSRCRCSMCPAIHINSRSWLRSSSTHEPSDPPHRGVFVCTLNGTTRGRLSTAGGPRFGAVHGARRRSF